MDVSGSFFVTFSLQDKKLKRDYVEYAQAAIFPGSLTAVDMNPSSPSPPVLPNRPLRKPSSGPGLPLPAPSRLPTISAAAPLRPAGNGPTSLPTNKDKSLPMSRLVPPSFTVYSCNFCGQQGNGRCMRCKKTSYCSVVCQTEDWKIHRLACKPADPEPAKGNPKGGMAVLSSAPRENPAKLQAGDSSSYKKVYLKDLQASKVTKGMDIQATVVEFTSPGRFFIFPQIPEVIESLQIITTGLQKTCSNSSGTTYVPCDGEVCKVQFSFDKKWYRGLVQTLAADKKTANILYIDFGNEENVPVERIRPLPANIPHFCPCTMECQTAGVSPVVSKWSDECCITVRQLLAGKAVTVKVLEMREEESCHDVDILLSKGELLSTFLLENGYGLKETTDAPPTVHDISAILNASFENFKRLSAGKDDNEWAQPPEPLTQAIGDQFSVVVTHFLSPSDLVVQKVDNAGLMQDLQLKLREHCSQVSTPQNFRPAPGTVCCAQFSEDKLWYRAKVLAYPSEERVCIGYLDFGNSEEVDLGQLLPISAPLLALPTQAIPCALAGVKPVGASWSNDCILALQCQLSNRVLRLKIQGTQEGKTLVSMINEASDPQIDFAELLIAAGYAAPASVSATPNLPAEETPAAAESSASPSVSEPLVWTTAQLPSDGQMVPLVTIIVESPGKFYCHLSSSTELQKLIELQGQLKQHCEAEAPTFVPKVGEPCCALFPGNGSWCRAMVKELSGDKVAIDFVDYGYSMRIKNVHLRSITPKLLALPFQAVCCWLAGVEPVGSEWSSEALLWFQTLMDGQELSGRVLSVNEQGYGVELVIRGQNVAVALIAEELAKAREQPARVTQEQSAPPEANTDGEKKKESCEASGEIKAVTEEMPVEVKSAATSDVACFPVDWKTVELPLNESFQPCVAAVISPSLFYLHSPMQVDQQKLQKVMLDLAAYCGTYKATSSAGRKSRPAAGAACCAQFSADKNWYRAVILEVGENEMSVIYADYGNTERVSAFQILPIPGHLLELPFQITRCTLAGKEHFPAVYPEEVLQLFQTELVNGVQATVHSFDGSANVLSLILPAERGGEHLTSVILDALYACSKSNQDTNQRLDNPGSSAPCAADGPRSDSVPEPACEPEPVDTAGSVTPADLTARNPQQEIVSVAPVVEDPVKKVIDQMEPPYQNQSKALDHQTSGCCCQSLQKQISNLEGVMQLQLSLIKQLVNQIK
ncbi:tudor domain-containing protein 1 isoform X2 [Fundulus heteroclitus]|uniref:tudor domain-containing protein 1 isoform X2 n=1 Tax=Fundulus heteroclitus TaxID=8078 RepID=UPI00165B5552|nr:tudor domain-containing protein 1 isoform X2 [Fundulus heteroclitus]